MSAHGEAAEQVVDMATKATVKGVEVVANLTGKGLISLATFLIATLKEQKRTKGKTRIEAFRGKPTKVFVMRREDFSAVCCGSKEIRRPVCRGHEQKRRGRYGRRGCQCQ